MKPSLFLAIAVTAALTFPAMAADSKRTADYILANNAEYEGKPVTLDVAFVKPVQWKSPIPELAFFHAQTIDRIDHKPGGEILVAVSATESSSFAKKYGMEFKNRFDSTMLRGTLLAAPGRGPDKFAPRARVWFIDTTGQASDLIKAKKLELLDDGGPEGDGGPGMGGGPGRKHGGPGKFGGQPPQ